MGQASPSGSKNVRGVVASVNSEQNVSVVTASSCTSSTCTFSSRALTGCLSSVDIELFGWSGRRVVGGSSSTL
jgi:hypothetical protein